MIEAETEYRKLLKRNPDNRQYYFGLEEARRLTTDTQKLLLYAELRETYPRAMLARRIPLSYASGKMFRSLVDQYLRHALHKGAPPLFVDLRSLYTQPGKADIIEELLLGYIDSLTKCERFDEKGFPIF
jgi:peptide alpha-N-acetyltransferase